MNPFQSIGQTQWNPDYWPLPPAPFKFQIYRTKYAGEPDKFALSRTSSQYGPRVADETLNFRFRTRFISAKSSIASQDHPRLRRIQLCPSRIAPFFAWLAAILAAPASSFLRRILPEWFLPRVCILQIERQEGTKYHDTEIEAYNRLQPLQGTMVPTLYGTAVCQGRRALLLEDVGGVSLAEPAGLTLELGELSQLLQDCWFALSRCGVLQCDPLLGNFILVDGKLKAVDFDIADFDPHTEKGILMDIMFMARNYEDQRRFMWAEGFLEAA